MLVDMHAHVIPKEFPDLDERLAGLVQRESAFFDPERRLAAMAASGVDLEVVSPLPPLLGYELAPRRARDTSRLVNEAIAQLCATAPERFLGLGTVPLQQPDVAAGELSGIKGIGLHGIEIGSNVGGRSLDDDRFLGFFQEVERLRIPVFVHALSPALGERLPGAAMATFGFATEVTLAAASIITGGLADTCPGLRLAFSHGAGGFPLMLTRAQYFWGGTWNEEGRAEAPGGPGGRSGPRGPGGPGGPGGPEQPQRSPAEHARRFWYDTLVFDRRALRYLIDMLGPSQLLVGTDFPAMAREQPAGRTLRSMGLAPDVLDDITWNNCFRFLGIEPPAPGRA